MYVAPKIVSGRVVNTRMVAVHAREREIDLRTFRPADPVPLLFERAGRPVECTGIAQQPVCIRRDAHHPLLHRTAFDGVPFLDPLVHLFVREHCAESFTPVHRDLGNVRETVARKNILLFLPRHRLPLGRRERCLRRECSGTVRRELSDRVR